MKKIKIFENFWIKKLDATCFLNGFSILEPSTTNTCRVISDVQFISSKKFSFESSSTWSQNFSSAGKNRTPNASNLKICSRIGERFLVIKQKSNSCRVMVHNLWRKNGNSKYLNIFHHFKCKRYWRDRSKCQNFRLFFSIFTLWKTDFSNFKK